MPPHPRLWCEPYGSHLWRDFQLSPAKLVHMDAHSYESPPRGEDIAQTGKLRTVLVQGGRPPEGAIWTVASEQ